MTSRPFDDYDQMSAKLAQLDRAWIGKTDLLVTGFEFAECVVIQIEYFGLFASITAPDDPTNRQQRALPEPDQHVT